MLCNWVYVVHLGRSSHPACLPAGFADGVLRQVPLPDGLPEASTDAAVVLHAIAVDRLGITLARRSVSGRLPRHVRCWPSAV